MKNAYPWLTDIESHLPDLRRRLAQLPSTARVRGILFTQLRQRAKALGISAEYAETFGSRDPFKKNDWYPLEGYFLRVLRIAQLAFGVRNIKRGMSEAIDFGSRRDWRMFAAKVLAMLEGNGVRAFIEMVHVATLKVKHYIVPTTLIFESRSRGFVVHVASAYIYFEETVTHMVTALARFFEVDARVRVERDNDFDGRVVVTFGRD